MANFTSWANSLGPHAFAELPNDTMKDLILRLLGQSNYSPSKVPELLRLLEQLPNQQQELCKALGDLQRDKRILRLRGNRYVLATASQVNQTSGHLQLTRNGRGFVKPDDASMTEIAVPAKATGNALHGDRVLVHSTDRFVTGEVIRVLQRSKTRIVGTLHRRDKSLSVRPDDPRFPRFRVAQPRRKLNRPAKHGEKVVIKPAQWASLNTPPQGEIIEVIGHPSADGVDMLGILHQYELRLDFPAKAMREVDQHGTQITEKDCSGRTDCRHHSVITIDPTDAKDFDDAFCLKQVSKDQWKLWVHIADVSHYVRPSSALDAEARKRGNSTYLVDRVIPMLPEQLSNELCSLKPQVDRLTKCVEFLMTEDGEVLNSKFYSAVIRSRRRFTYEEAMSVIEAKPTSTIERMVHDANRIAQKIRQRRFRAGSLDLDFPETKIILDPKGRVEEIEVHQSDASHQLIEEFMLLTNEAAAKRLRALKKPSIHRSHETPDPRRLQNYRKNVESHQVKCGDLEKPREIHKLLKQLGTLPIGGALKIGFLRSLTRAHYSVEPMGHYGLAKSDYAHFTSPIRRYADLAVHRSLFTRDRSDAKALAETAHHISQTERNSAEAERNSRDLKLQAYLEAQLASGKLQTYTGLVTEVSSLGLFVDIPDLGLSGLVPFRLLDNYKFDQGRRRFQSLRKHRPMQVGSRVQVSVARVDLEKKQVDFKLAFREQAQHPMKRRPRYRSPRRKAAKLRCTLKVEKSLTLHDQTHHNPIR